MFDFTGISRAYMERVFEAEIRAEEHLEAGQRKLLGSLLHAGARRQTTSCYDLMSWR